MNQSNLTIEQFAEQFGATAEGVRKWLKDGLPSVREKSGGKRAKILIPSEEGRKWLVANNVRQFVKTNISANSNPDDVVARLRDITVAPGVAGALERLQRMELDSWQGYIDAAETNDILGQQAWAKVHAEAVRRMVEAEEEIVRRETMKKEIEEEVAIEIRKWAEPIASLINQMPRSLAQRVNPSDPIYAEKVLVDYKDNQLLPMMVKK